MKAAGYSLNTAVLSELIYCYALNNGLRNSYVDSFAFASYLTLFSAIITYSIDREITA